MIRDNISDGRIIQNAAAILGRVFIADSTLEIHSYFLPVKAKKRVAQKAGFPLTEWRFPVTLYLLRGLLGGSPEGKA